MTVDPSAPGCLGHRQRRVRSACWEIDQLLLEIEQAQERMLSLEAKLSLMEDPTRRAIGAETAVDAILAEATPGVTADERAQIINLVLAGHSRGRLRTRPDPLDD
jgi:hypothetical protein